VLIVIDTLNRTMTGSESNDADMTAYIGAADQLREAFSAAITIIHHCGVNGDRPRGHTSLGGAVDAQISVKKDATGVHTIVEWMKDGPEGEATVSRLVPVEVGVDDDGDPISSLVVEEIEAADQQRRSDRKKVQPNLSPKQQIALDQLRKAISAYGQPAPPHNYIPTNAPVVSTELWRRFYLSGTSADEQNDNTRRKAWRDARDALQAKGVIGICDEMVWEL
jgi:hypothetical protein